MDVLKFVVSGIYFATDAAYSLKFAFQCKAMFMARVVCGVATLGKATYTRPPENPADDRFYDSCVNRLDRPGIYVIFDNSQVYPEVVVEF